MTEVCDLVTKFLLNTCRLGPLPSLDAVRATLSCVEYATTRPDNEPEADLVPLTTGSVAEFYIQPMLSCVGDEDTMFHRSTQLAIPAGHPPPTQLPADFHSYVKLFEIIDSDWPGYVYLRLYGLLSQSDDGEKYTFWKSEEQPYKVNDITGGKREMHGPAMTDVVSLRSLRSLSLRVTDDAESLSIDSVFCVRCLSWPTQAANWLTRHRNYGWPDTAIVDRVVSNGCDVVGVAHPQCRQHHWEGRYQWRLSFSRAEVVLLNSWMPVQQTSYHMLRVFVKTERLTDSADNSGTKILSNYHIKTLMLWTCELKPRDWWTDDLNYVRICTTLLHTLAAWIRDAQCLQYFVPDCNLFDFDNYSNSASQLVCNLASLTESWLSTWFVNNYIRKCETRCSTITENMNLKTELSLITNWRQKTILIWLKDCFFTREAALNSIMKHLCSQCLTVRTTRIWLQKLENLDHNLNVWFTAVAFLHVARLSASSEHRCGFMDLLTTLCLYLNGRTEECCLIQKDISQLFNTATFFLKLSVNKPFNTETLTQIELSKTHLHEVLQYQNPGLLPDHDSLLCLSHVYLAALYYTTGQYQAAADHCALVTSTNDHAQPCSHVVEAELLPKTDDDIDNVLGLVAFYQYLLKAAMKDNQQKQYSGGLDVTLFAHFLHIKCIMSATTCFIPRLSTADAIWQYQQYASSLKELFVTDVVLFKILLNCRFQQQLYKKNTVQDAIDLKQLLVQSAVVHLTIFRQLESRYFGSVATIVTTDFEALYAYRYGEYQHCLQLCRQNVHTLLDTREKPNVLAFPEFLQLMDNDIVSLVGLTLIAYPQCRDDSDYVAVCYISQLTLSLYLLTQCQLKLRQSKALLHLTLCYIKRAQRIHSGPRTLDRLTLRLAERKLSVIVRSRRY